MMKQIQHSTFHHLPPKSKTVICNCHILKIILNYYG